MACTLDVQTFFIEKGVLGRTVAVKAPNGKLRVELLNGERFNSLREAQIVIEEWRRPYNAVRPHSALGYRPPPLDQP